MKFQLMCEDVREDIIDNLELFVCLAGCEEADGETSAFACYDGVDGS